jgi:hypothetical protein
MSLTHIYRICDLTLASNVPLPEIVPATVIEFDCRFELMSARCPAPDNVAWFHKWSVDNDGKDGGEEPWVCFGFSGDGYLLRFPSCGDFVLSGDLRKIQCRPLPGIPKATVRHLLLDQVIPLVLSRREGTVLHASAVLAAQGVLAFVGKSGQGKSTLATSFAQKGCALVSDDCLALRAENGGWVVLPSYPGVRLWPSAAEELLGEDADTSSVAHYTIKRRAGDMGVLPFSACSAPLRAFFFLADEAPTISMERLSPRQAFMAFVKFAFVLDITDTVFLRDQFETFGLLSEAVPAYTVRYPREFASLPAVREAILHRIEEDQHDSGRQLVRS